jgi:putative Mn2+ efflux pump MntP
MTWSFTFFFNSVLLGIGLAMDAFSVSLANGLNEPTMSKKKMCGIAGIFAFFQALMPMLGWFLIRTLCSCFNQFQKLIPWIALILLGFIGGKMLLEGIKNQESETEKSGLGFGVLIVQGIATSIDALSVGCTISEYGFFMALVSAFIIALVTFGICFSGLIIGKKFGTKIAGKASILGGVILIFIGLEIFVTGVFF